MNIKKWGLTSGKLSGTKPAPSTAPKSDLKILDNKKAIVKGKAIK